MKRVAVMQPYFLPYAGYFRLHLSVDEFVIFDCVQFPRRGRVHRTEVPGPGSQSEWLTLPLARQRRDVLIRDLAFAAEARSLLDARLAHLPWVRSTRGPAADQVREYLFAPLEAVIDYLESGMRLVLELLDIRVRLRRSSSLALDSIQRGQDRVISAVRAVGGTHYLNPPGGRSLYSDEAFSRNGVALSFLPVYKGSFFQLLPALMQYDPAALRADICQSVAAAQFTENLSR